MSFMATIIISMRVKFCNSYIHNIGGTVIPQYTIFYNLPLLPPFAENILLTTPVSNPFKLESWLSNIQCHAHFHAACFISLICLIKISQFKKQ